MQRFRRLRRDERIRTMMQETRLDLRELIYPLFVIEGEGIENPVPSMPGVFQYSVDRLEGILTRIERAGIGGVMLFGIPKYKDETGSRAWAKDGVVQQALAYMKAHHPLVYRIVDVCLCEYTSHGHCGLVQGEEILNDETLPLLAKTAVSLAEAGADMIAPSDMMDGRVGAIRQALDKAGFIQTPIMAYSAKFASAYYGPFREAARSAPGFGDRKSYQMDVANGKEALQEIGADIGEGADIVMVKPGLAYLDIVKEASLTFATPLAVYNVSGEYAMVKAAAAQGWIDERRVVTENLIAMKRAGAQLIITYHALDVAEWWLE